MSKAKFKIGDRVKLVPYEGIYAAVVDSFFSLSTGWRYEIENSNGLLFFCREDELELVSEKKEYGMDIKIDIAKNVVIASLFEKTDDDMRPLAKGHGHLIHEGANGIAQAASYACKKLYESLGGQIVKGGYWK